MVILAPAKVNMALTVLGKRSDGYHELDSLMVPVSLYDEVSLEKADDFSLEFVADGVDLGAMGDTAHNLVSRAVQLLERECGHKLGVHCRVLKRIPLGGGLGGGSADAAATLKGVNALYDLGLSKTRLVALGAELGSDVPAMVLGGYVRMRGRGERVEAFGGKSVAPPVWLILANPGVHCPTKEIYENSVLGLTDGGGLVHNMGLLLCEGRIDALSQALYNGLESAAYRLYPPVAGAAEALRRGGCRGVLLSGSGATVFGVVASEAEGKKIISSLGASGYWLALVHTLPDGVMAAHGPLTP